MPTEAKEFSSPGPGVTGNCEPPDQGAGNQTWDLGSSARAVWTLDY